MFNANRYPLGRMAEKISKLIRGKHKPTYLQNSIKDGDKCVVVNMDDPYVTGRKRETLLYRHHTGYPGGLKEITFKDMLARKPEQILIRTLLGMMPKNDLSRQAIKQNVIIYREPWHNMGKILPQFTMPKARDINLDYGILDPQKTTIKYASDPKDLPEEFKNSPIDIDDTLDIPLTISEKTHTNPRSNAYLGQNMQRSYIHQRKFRKN